MQKKEILFTSLRISVGLRDILSRMKTDPKSKYYRKNADHIIKELLKHDGRNSGQ